MISEYSQVNDWNKTIYAIKCAQIVLDVGNMNHTL